MTMREIILLRHAHAEAATPGQDDASRPLSAQGEAEADAAGVWLKQHGLDHPTAVAPDPLGDRPLDLGVAPPAQALLAMSGDVARDRAGPALGQALDERRQERPAAGAERGVEQHRALVVERRVAFEAVSDRRQVGTAAHLVLHDP